MVARVCGVAQTQGAGSSGNGQQLVAAVAAAGQARRTGGTMLSAHGDTTGLVAPGRPRLLSTWSLQAERGGNSSVKGAHWGQSQPTHASALGMPVSTPVSTAVSTPDSAPVGEASFYKLEEAGGVAEAQVLHAVPVCHAAPQGDHLDRLPRQQLGCNTAQSGAAAIKGSALLHLFGGEDRRPGQLQMNLRGGELGT